MLDFWVTPSITGANCHTGTMLVSNRSCNSKPKMPGSNRTVQREILKPTVAPGRPMVVSDGFLFDSRVQAVSLNHSNQNDGLYLEIDSASWVKTHQLPHGWANFAHGYENGKFYMFGGSQEYGTALLDFYEYDPETGVITALPVNDISARTYAYGHCQDGKFYVWGGFPTHLWDTANYFNELWEYDIELQVWTQLASPVSSISNKLVGGYGKLYVPFVMTPDPGGNGYLINKTVWEYDIATDNWTNLFTMAYSPSEYFFDGFLFQGGWIWYNNENDLIQIIPDDQTFTEPVEINALERNTPGILIYGKYILFLHGYGSGGTSIYLDVSYIDVDTMTAGGVGIIGEPPPAYYGFGHFVHNDILYLVGGQPEEGDYDSWIWKLNLNEFFYEK